MQLLAQASQPPHPSQQEQQQQLSLPSENLEPSRVELGERADGSRYTRVVEVPVNSTGLTWEKVFDGISSGSWAVLLFLGLAFYLLKGSATKYIESQITLMAAMRDNLKETKTDIDELNEIMPRHTEMLLSIKVNTDNTNRSVRKLHENLPVFQSRYDNLQEAVHELKDMLDRHPEPKRPIKKIQAWVGETYEEE